MKLLDEGQDVAAIHKVTPLIEALEERYIVESSLSGLYNQGFLLDMQGLSFHFSLRKTG